MTRTTIPRSQWMRPVASLRLPKGDAKTIVLSLSIFALLNAPLSSWQGSRPPSSGDLPATVPDMLPANVQPSQFAEISAPVDGIVLRVDVSEGIAVESGQQLALIDNRVALAAVRLAEITAAAAAPIELAELQRLSAQRQLERIQIAHKQSAASSVELEDARSRVTETDALLRQVTERTEQFEASLQHERAILAEHNVIAPFAGTVLRIDVQPGEMASRSRPIVTLANLFVLKAELYVPVRFYGTLRIGQPLQLQADAPVNDTVVGVLQYIEPIVDAASVSFRCVVEIDNAQQQYPAGFQVRWITPDVVPTNYAASTR